MAKSTINILCPSGHRRKAQMTPNTNLLQVLEDMCNQESLDSFEWGLIHQRKKCDLTIPWRLLGIPTNALLEMFKLEERRPMSDVTIQLQLPDNSRYAGSFNPSISLNDMLNWYRTQSDSTIVNFETSLTDINQMLPVCSYMSEEVIGEYALSNTTLRELGLTSGTAVIRYARRSISEEELKKVNERIDSKLARRQPKQQTPSPATPAIPSFPTTTSIPTTTPTPVHPVVNTTTSLFDTQEYSIFRDIPASLPRTTTSQQKRKTLAEELGINIDLNESTARTVRQTDFSNFKFPEATKGEDLNQMNNEKPRQREHSNTCERHAIAYDLTKISKTNDQSEEIPDSFFEVTADDLRSVLHSLRQQSSEDNPIETRSMRERVRSARTVAYENVVIRLVVSTSHVLQAFFHPNEPVSNLVAFARTNLIFSQLKQLDFYLYTSPPRVVLSDLNKPLSTYDLTPAAYVYIGHKKVSPLLIQIGSNVPFATIDEANQLVQQYVFSRTVPLDENEIKTNSNQQSKSETTSRSIKRNVPATNTNIDDKSLRDKFQKFLPNKK